MLHLANRTQALACKVARTSSQRGSSSTRAQRSLTSRRFSTASTLADSSNPSALKLLALGGLALGASAIVYSVNGRETHSKAETDTVEPVAEQRDILTKLTKGATYIVGDCTLPGKLDDDALLLPQVLLHKSNIKNVSIGTGEGWAIDASGKLHSWSQKTSLGPFSKLSGYSFKQVECGSNGFVALLQTNGSVWIRFTPDTDFVLINKGDLRRKTVSKVTVGANHAAAITTDGSLYTIGSNERGQCGVQDLKQSPNDSPFLVSWPAKFTDVSTGLYHTAAVTNDGKVVTFGYNKNLQLGKPQEWVQYTPPSVPMVPFGSYAEVRESEQKRFNSKNWVDTTEYITQYAHTIPAVPEFFAKGEIQAARVICGDEFTFVLDKNGQLYGFGDGSRGQLARKPARSYTAPTAIRRDPFTTTPLDNISTISCGSAHCMALLKNGELWTWGHNLSGECARSNKLFTPVPTKIAVDSDHPVTNVTCTKSASVIYL